MCVYTVVCTLVVCVLIYLNCCDHKVIIWWKSQRNKHSHTREVRVPWVKLGSERNQREGKHMVEHLPFGVITTEFSDGASPESGATLSEYVTDISEECKCLFQSMKRQQHIQTHIYAEGQETIQYTHSQTLIYIYIYMLSHTHTQWASFIKHKQKKLLLAFHKRCPLSGQKKMENSPKQWKKMKWSLKRENGHHSNFFVYVSYLGYIGFLSITGCT